MLKVEGLGKSFATTTGTVDVFKGLSFYAAQGEFVCIVGPSGAGKTTLLRCIAGLLPPTTGSIHIDGRELSGPPDGLRVVFQDYTRSLFPWLTVQANVMLPLRSMRLSKAEQVARAAEALEAVDLSESRRQHPWQLSGGMQQRVAIARALACRPSVLLMDEPFASVDAQTRADLEDLSLRVRDRLGMTAVLVTHDIDEAVYLGDRVLALSGVRPTRLVASLPIDLGANRNQMLTRSLPAFGSLRTEVLSYIKRGGPGGDSAEETLSIATATDTALASSDMGRTSREEQTVRRRT